MKVKPLIALAVASSLGSGVALASASTAQGNTVSSTQISSVRTVSASTMSTTQAVTTLRTATSGTASANAVPERQVLQAIQVIGARAPQSAKSASSTSGLLATDKVHRAWWFAVRLAVKAALFAIKKRSVAMYKQIISYVKAGKTKFVSFWNKKIPKWAKTLMGSISAAAIYDAIRWILGF